MAFNATLALALAQVSQIDGANLNNTGSEPSLADATELWTRAYQEIRLAFRGADLDPDTITASSSADVLANNAESLLTCIKCLDARSGITDDDAAQSDRLLARLLAITGRVNDDGEFIPGDIHRLRTVLLSEGMTALNRTAAPTTRIGSRQLNDVDPASDQNTLNTDGMHYVPAVSKIAQGGSGAF